jgi:multidrug efflux pump subunit AcrA (membrane-fusion protein)
MARSTIVKRSSTLNIAPRTAVWVCLAGLLIVNCSEKIEPGQTPPPEGPAVRAPVATVERALNPLIYEAVGTVHARVTATVSSKLLATIRHFAVKEGDRVRQGDLLVELDQRQVVAQSNQARAGLAEAEKALSAALSMRLAAEAAAGQAQRTYERNQALVADDVVTRETFEAAESSHKQAQADLARAEAMVAAARARVQQSRAAMDAAQVTRDDARVLAPYDGRVTAKLADTGDLAAPGTPLLILERDEGYRVDLMVPEVHIQHLRSGQRVAVQIPAATKTSMVGQVEVIVPSADSTTRTVVVQVRLPDEPSLRTGMFVRAALPVGEALSLRIPASAVVRQGQLTGVFFVDETNIARFRLVRVGRSYDGKVEIIAGIPNGTRVVTQPPPDFANGSVVEPAP